MEAIVLVLAVLAGLIAGAIGCALLLRRAAATQLEQAVTAAANLARAEAQSAGGAQLATLGERATTLQLRLQGAQNELAGLQAQLAEARDAVARLETSLQREREQGGEKLALLEQARAALTDQFKTLAAEILEDKSKRFTEQNRSQIDLLLKPLADKLLSFEKTVQDTYVTEAKERHSLADEVRKLQTLNAQIGIDAVNLTRALKGDSKTRGNWGEVMLERILERSGLEKGREYETQVTVDGEDGKLRPDVVVRLPDDKHIVIDSKVSLVAYDRYYAVDTDAEREVLLREHVAAMRRHIAELSAKNYQGRPGINAPDFVAMFVPIEPAFNLAAASDESLVLDAFQKKVVIVTPNTLLAMLSTVASLWKRELQTRNVLEIARQSGDLYDKFVGFVGALQDIGTRLDAARDAYDTAYKRLAEGRGNLVARVTNLKKLGAKAEKELPAGLVETALGEDDLGLIGKGDSPESSSD